MTHDERIEAMARAINAEFYGHPWDETTAFRQGLCFDMALAALAAAGVEEMVREAAKLALYKALSNTPWGGHPDSTDEWCQSIVRAVMGK
jgi:hypothetical protein